MRPLGSWLLRLAVVTPPLAFSLACAGAWNSAVSAQFSELDTELERTVSPTSSEYALIHKMIEDGWIAAAEGHIGLAEQVPFGMALSTALEDRKLNQIELDTLAKLAEPFAIVAVSPERRAKLMLEKGEMDTRVRKESLRVQDDAPTVVLGGPGPSSPLAEWELPDDVELAAGSAGWAISGCSDQSEEGVAWVMCDGAKEERTAEFTAQRFADEAAATESDPGVASKRDGATLLTVAVQDETKAESLRDALLPAGSTFASLDRAAVERTLQAAGYTVDGCDAFTEGELAMTDCAASKDSHLVAINLVLARTPVGKVERVVELGLAAAYQGDSQMGVVVSDVRAAEALIQEMIP